MTHSQKVGSGDARVFATKVLILQMIVSLNVQHMY